MSIQNKVESVETIKPTREEAEEAVRTLISWTGDNPDRRSYRDAQESCESI